MIRVVTSFVENQKLVNFDFEKGVRWQIADTLSVYDSEEKLVVQFCREHIVFVERREK